LELLHLNQLVQLVQLTQNGPYPTCPSLSSRSLSKSLLVQLVIYPARIALTFIARPAQRSSSSSTLFQLIYIIRSAQSEPPSSCTPSA